MNLWSLTRAPDQRNHGSGHVGSGTAAVAVGPVVECNPAVTPGILASEYLHVVRHHRGRHNGARRHAGHHQHRARAQSEARALPPTARPLSQHRRQAGSARGFVDAAGDAVIRLYGLRFKIEHSFKQATRQIGSFAYHFWMKDMIPLLYRNGNQYLHRKSADYRSHVKRKINAYHVFIQAGVIAQGLLQYLAVASPKLVWDSFGSWLRTIRPGIPPSEFVVANALRQTLPEFLMSYSEAASLAKFIADRQDNGNMRIFRLAS